MKSPAVLAFLALVSATTLVMSLPAPYDTTFNGQSARAVGAAVLTTRDISPAIVDILKLRNEEYGTLWARTSPGEALKSLRTSRGLSQKQLAEKAGVSPSTVSSFESGGVSPALAILCKLAKALNVNVSALHGSGRC